MGQSLQRVGVKIIDSRDPLGRETFHPFVPEHHLIPGLVPRDNWYWEYNYYPAQEVRGMPNLFCFLETECRLFPPVTIFLDLFPHAGYFFTALY